MKALIKTTVLIALISIFTSCTKEEVFETSAIHHEVNNDIHTTVNVRVVPMENANIDFQQMVDEVNIDYFNRYGIEINLTLEDSESLPNEIKEEPQLWFPETKDEITLYIVPDQYTKSVMYNGSRRTYNGYAHGASFGSAKWAVVKESKHKSSTVAHELGHVLGLGHHGSWNDNVMGQFSTKEQRDIPSNFVQEQLDSIQLNLQTRERIQNWNSSAKANVNNVKFD